MVLFREAAALPEGATAPVSTLRQRLWKVGAVVRVRARRVQVQVSAPWPGRERRRVVAAVPAFVARLRGEGAAAPRSAALLS